MSCLSTRQSNYANLLQLISRFIPRREKIQLKMDFSRLKLEATSLIGCFVFRKSSAKPHQWTLYFMNASCENGKNPIFPYSICVRSASGVQHEFEYTLHIFECAFCELKRKAQSDVIPVKKKSDSFKWKSIKKSKWMEYRHTKRESTVTFYVATDRKRLSGIRGLGWLRKEVCWKQPTWLKCEPMSKDYTHIVRLICIQCVLAHT